MFASKGGIVLNKKGICGKIVKKKCVLEIDIMNRNTIISLAMLYATWQTKHKDILDLLRPFVLYAIGATTKINDRIDIDAICSCMEKEFGYSSFPQAIVTRILQRETVDIDDASKKNAVKKDGSFYLINCLDEHNALFAERRTKCKEKSDAVSVALSAYLSEKEACGRNNYTQEEAERYLLTFFEARGNSVLTSVDDLRQILSKNNEIEYFIARFILEHNEKRSIYMDYIVELVKGYYVTTALYYQAENPNITTASFKDVTFYLDTGILLAYLGYKSKPQNDSVQELVRSLKNNGANRACFNYNIEEVDNILTAYKMSKVYGSRGTSSTTLEYFDENEYSYSHVESEQRVFADMLKADGIVPVDPNAMLETHGSDRSTSGLLNDDAIKAGVLSIRPRYNLTTLPEDIQAINAISRVREGKTLRYIEKCKAVFVTKNTVLVSATKKFLEEQEVDVGFPLAITDEDLCVIAWLKDFKISNNLPKMRLLENVLAAINPTPELMDAYFSHINSLEKRGSISQDEATLLRIEHFARTELMSITHGNPAAVDEIVVDEIRCRMKEQSYQEGLDKGKKEAGEEAKKFIQIKRNKACKRAETEIDDEYAKKEIKGIRTIKIVAVVIALCFVCASIYSFINSVDGKISYALLLITLVTTVQGAWPFFGKDNWATNLFKRNLNKKKRVALDERKKKYLSLLE